MRVEGVRSVVRGWESGERRVVGFSCERLKKWRVKSGGIDRSVFKFVVFSFESLDVGIAANNTLDVAAL
ncbi:uncharacterized protein DS421_12g374460 [Arachis hypogaea]|nr:uncharacterized protein DS421_12g374460 [Arachis hypogaea]